MKVVNAVKLKEEVDYESLCRKLEYHVDYLTSETDRQQKLRENEKEQLEKKLKEKEAFLVETEKKFSVKYEHLEKERNHLELETQNLLKELNIQKSEKDKLSQEVGHLEISLKQAKQQELENLNYQKVLASTTQMYEKKIAQLIKQLEDESSRCADLEEQLSGIRHYLSGNKKSVQMQEKEVDELKREILKLNEDAASTIQSLRARNNELSLEKELLNGELKTLKDKLLYEERKRRCLEDEIIILKNALNDDNAEYESKRPYKGDATTRSMLSLGGPANIPKSNRSRETISGQKDTISKIFEEGKTSEDLDVQIHAVKVVANLAAEDVNQERIVEEGGLDTLLLLLESSEDVNIHRVTAGAIANLAMNSSNQGLIMGKGGARLLANIASKTEDPQTLRMIAGAIANLCGNEKLHVTLKKDGGIKALLGMVQCGHSDVVAQVARGFANFAKCESRAFYMIFHQDNFIESL
ncbi:KISc [Musa troglodytarum]|uniref:Vacuolar protein 8 n=1 Tax=Musa troglodytarum TaxID=320322 RepID=A0A9E7G0F0_9LILI|nr:KISc [Musa troglodytarum]